MKKIKLTQNRSALIDDADFDWLNQWKWHTHTSGLNQYAGRQVWKGTYTYMHRLIMGFPKEVDHINNNSLDNRRCNLRVCSRSQNNYNRKKSRGTSKHVGVYWSRQRKKWIAQISISGKIKNLGGYNSERKAITVYNKKLKTLQLN